MSDLQMSQAGLFFQKISLFDATFFDIAPLADSDDRAAALNAAQDTGVQAETLHSGSSDGMVFPRQSSIGTTHATELVLDSPGFFWPSYHHLDNSSSHVAY